MQYNKSYLYWLFAVCFLSGALGGVNSVLSSAYLPDLVRDLTGITTDAMTGKAGAWISFAFLTGWMFGGIGMGFLSDRIGRRAGLMLALICVGLGSGLGALAQSWEWIAMSRIFVGIGVGATLVLTPVLISEIWEGRTRAVVLGILSVSYPTGIVTSGLITYSVQDWRMAFFIGALPLLLAPVVRFTLYESPLWSNAKTSNRESSLSDYKPELISGILIYGAMLIGIWAAFSWLPTWVQSLTSSDSTVGQSERGLAIGLLGMGGMIGGVVSGFFTNLFGRKNLQAVCFIVSLLLSYLLFQLNVTYTWRVPVGIACLGFTFGLSQGVLNTYIPELFPAAIRSAATGLSFNIGRTFTAAAVFFVGVFVTWFGSYGNAIFAFSTIYVLGLLAMLLNSKSSKRVSREITQSETIS